MKLFYTTKKASVYKCWHVHVSSFKSVEFMFGLEALITNKVQPFRSKLLKNPTVSVNWMCEMKITYLESHGW